MGITDQDVQKIMARARLMHWNAAGAPLAQETHVRAVPDAQGDETGFAQG